MKAFHEVRSYTSNFMMWHSAYRNISFLSHWHNEMELIYSRDGSSSITVNDDTFLLGAGDLILCGSGDIHYCDSPDPKNALDFLVFDPGLLDPQYRATLCPSHYISQETLDSLSLSPLLEALFDRLPLELEKREPYYQEVATALLREFWYLLKRRLPTEPRSQSHRGDMLEEFHQLLHYLDEHYAEPITLEFAAGRLSYSPSHFSKIFKKLMGINFVTYLSMIRVEQACALLKNSSRRAIDVALFCGFNNLRTFNRTFKEVTGYTPIQFRLLPDVDSYTLTYYKRRSMEQAVANIGSDSPTVINH